MGYHKRLVTAWKIVPRVLQRNVSVTWVETLITTFDTATVRTTSGSNLKVWYELGSWKKNLARFKAKLRNTRLSHL